MQAQKHQLGEKIRSNGHMLDVLMQYSTPDRVKTEQIYNTLHSLLTEWQKTYPAGDDIQWAQHIAERYLLWATQPKQILPKEQVKKVHKNEDVMSCIRNRRSVRYWQSKAVPQAILDQIIEAGTWAPSAFNLQPWTFIVEHNELKNMVTGDSSNASILAKAPAKIYIAVDTQFYKEQYAPAIDTATAGQNMLLAAHALGLGGCMMYQGELIDQQAFCNKHNLQPSWTVLAAIVLGYPLCEPATPGRTDIHDCMLISKT